jgi:hypothetical protein
MEKASQSVFLNLEQSIAKEQYDDVRWRKCATASAINV